MSAPLDWRSWSEEERQAQVSPSSVIGGNYEPYVELYLRESREAVDLLHDTSTLGVVAPDSGYPVDVFLAPINGGPVLVSIHGGYWQDLHRKYSWFASQVNASALNVGRNGTFSSTVSVRRGKPLARSGR